MTMEMTTEDLQMIINTLSAQKAQAELALLEKQVVINKLTARVDELEKPAESDGE